MKLLKPLLPSLKSKQAHKKINAEKNASKHALGDHGAKASLTNEKSSDYFSTAKSWADDYYALAVTWKERYKHLFLIMSGLTFALTIATSVLAFHQNTELVVVHQYEDGSVWVEPAKQPMAPKNQAQIESEIVRYVQNRESFNPGSYDEQYSLVELLSNTKTANQYANEQSQDNRTSPINTLGAKGSRTVHVDNVLFLDSANVQIKKKEGRAYPHTNLAQVNFTLIDHHNRTSSTTQRPMTALISWEYTGTPDNPDKRWRNWDGFRVTRYTTTERNLTKEEPTS